MSDAAVFEPAPHDRTDKPGVLVVDDEQTVLTAVLRVLRPDGIRVLVAGSGEEALQLLEAHAPSIGAVVSDYAMPALNGAELLRSVRLRWPDITRVLLTGNADLAAAARTVNEGQPARLLTKPWQPAELREAVSQALTQHLLVTENGRLRRLADDQAERLAEWNRRLEELVSQRTAELQEANASLQRGLLDTVRLLFLQLERRAPKRAAACREVARMAGRLAEGSGMSATDVRQVQVAALIHDIGLMVLPDHVLNKQHADLPMAARVVYEQHPLVGETMLGTVEQLGAMRRWIRHHHERWDGRGYPDRLVGASIPVVARIIGLADSYADAVSREGGTAVAWRRLQRMSGGAFDPELLRLLDELLDGRPAPEPVESAQADAVVGSPVQLVDLEPGAQLVAAIRMRAGSVLLPAGETLTIEQVERVRSLVNQRALEGDTVLVRARDHEKSVA